MSGSRLDVARIVWEVNVVSTANAAAATFMLCDITAVFPRELDSIWRSPWSAPKVLYLTCRYYAFLHVCFFLYTFSRVQTSLTFCRAFFWFHILCGPLMVFETVNIILLFRLHALYSRSKPVLITLVVLTVAEFIAPVYLHVDVVKGITAHMVLAPPFLPLSGCLSTYSSDKLRQGAMAIWLLSLSLSTVYFGFMVYNFIGRLNGSGTDPQRIKKRLRNLTPLLQTFYRDGTACFVVIEAVIAIATVISTTLPAPLSLIQVPLLLPVASIMGSRLILHLREAAATEPSERFNDEALAGALASQTELNDLS